MYIFSLVKIAHKHEIRVSTAELRSNGGLFRFTQWLVGHVGPVATNVYFSIGNAICFHQIFLSVVGNRMYPFCNPCKFWKTVAVIRPVGVWQVHRPVFKIQVMDNCQLGNRGAQAQHAIWRHENVRFLFLQPPGQHVIKPQNVQQWMSGRRWDYMCRYIMGENARRVKWPVKQEMEFMPGMLPGYASHGFIGEPSDPIEAAGLKQSGINGYFQKARLKRETNGTDLPRGQGSKQKPARC